MITRKEIDAIRFYQGDIRKRDENGNITEDVQEEGFFGTPSVYRTINCLMFDGIINEKDRIKEGNGKIVPDILLQIDEIIEVYCDIYRAMCKSIEGCRDEKKRLVYRTDRGSSIEQLKKGYTISFTSTSKENKPEKFLKKKTNLTLLNIVVPKDVPQLDFQNALGDDYLFAQQKEILLPPFLKIHLEKMELTEEEQQYRDADNQPPSAKYLVMVDGLLEKNPEEAYSSGEPLTAKRNKKSVEILNKMINHKELTETEVKLYCSWKRDFRRIIWIEFQKIREEILTEEHLNRKSRLMADVKQMAGDFNKKRKDYKCKMKFYNIVLAITGLIPVVCIALSFAERIQLEMKIAAVIASAVAVLMTRVLKVEAYGVKLRQRTKTYLRLCDLYREMKYDYKWNDEKERAYVEKYREIMREDTMMSLQNLQEQLKNGELLYQDDIIYR